MPLAEVSARRLASTGNVQSRRFLAAGPFSLEVCSYCAVSATLMAKPPGVALSGRTAAPATTSNEERLASGAQAGPSPHSAHLQQMPRRSQPVTGKNASNDM